MVVGGIVVLTNVVATPQWVFEGKSADEWRQELTGGDVAASNRANGVLNTVIFPELTDAGLHDTNDSALKLAIVAALNKLPGVQIS